jgi:hypothetical protein
MEVLVIPELALGGWVAVSTATISMKTPIMKAPPSSEPRRPILSTRKIRKNRHETTLTTPKKPLISSELSPAPTALKIWGETIHVSVSPGLFRHMVSVQYARDVLPVSWTPAKEPR